PLCCSSTWVSSCCSCTFRFNFWLPVTSRPSFRTFLRPSDPQGLPTPSLPSFTPPGMVGSPTMICFLQALSPTPVEGFLTF
ncbi:hypothetical protein CSUI_009621, partial [Cystoisospora suis]